MDGRISKFVSPRAAYFVIQARAWLKFEALVFWIATITRARRRSFQTSFWLESRGATSSTLTPPIPRTLRRVSLARSPHSLLFRAAPRVDCNLHRHHHHLSHRPRTYPLFPLTVQVLQPPLTFLSVYCSYQRHLIRPKLTICRPSSHLCQLEGTFC